jgi:hypothetical protein
VPQRTDEIPDVDLDAAMDRTMTRHRELVHQRTVRRRWMTGGVCAVVIAAAAIVVPQLGDDGQHLNVADGGGAAATTTTAVAMPAAPPGFVLTRDGDVWVLTRADDTPATTVPATGDVGVGQAATASRPTPVASVAPGAAASSVVLGFVGCGQGHDIESVRYRYAEGHLTVNAALQPMFCPASPPEPISTIEIPLPSPWVPGTPVGAASL